MPLVVQDEVDRESEIHEHVRAVEGEFRRDTGLGPFREFVAGAKRQTEIVGAAHAMGAEVDQVAALKSDGSIIARRRVMEPVQLNKWIDFMGIEQIIIQVIAAEEVIGPLRIHAGGIAHRGQEVHAAEGGSPEILA